jgi:hypothetical protein
MVFGLSFNQMPTPPSAKKKLTFKSVKDLVFPRSYVSTNKAKTGTATFTHDNFVTADYLEARLKVHDGESFDTKSYIEVNGDICGVTKKSNLYKALFNDDMEIKEVTKPAATNVSLSDESNVSRREPVSVTS